MRENKHKTFSRQFGPKISAITEKTDSEQELIQNRTLAVLSFFCSAISYRIARPVTRQLYYPSMDSCFSICPRCDMTIEREYMQFCDRCGQKLSWEQFENAEIIVWPRR